MHRAVLPILALSLLLTAGCRNARPAHFMDQTAAANPATAPAEGEALLSRIEQLTTPDMGFERAGEAYFSPDSSHIIFQAVPRGREGYQIYVMSLDDRRPRMVSTGKGECTCAFVRPDGRKIIFASSHLDPGLTAAQTRPAGEKPGYQVKERRYAWHFNEHMDIFEADLDGSNLKRLTDAAGYDAEGAYGPDGRQIAFTSQRSGDLELWLMNADGSNLRRITHAEGYDGGPFISPDGERIVFRADRRGDDLLQLFVIDLDGRNERRLTDNAYVNWGPYWHPNGRSIVYATSRHGHENYEVYLMNIETGREQRVTDAPGFDGLPVFSNDGRRLMWTSKRGPDSTPQVFIADFHLPEGF